MKDAVDVATTELPLNDERKPERKRGRHETIALNHLKKQRDNLLAKHETLTKEIDSLEAAIAALE